MQKIAFGILAVGLMAVPALADSAPPGIKRTPLQSIEFPDGYKTVTGLAEVALARVPPLEVELEPSVSDGTKT